MDKDTDVQYLEAILKPLLSLPEELQVNRSTDERGVYIILKVAQADMPRVIGRGGQTAQAFRTLMRQFGGLTQRMISIKIEEPSGARRPRQEY